MIYLFDPITAEKVETTYSKVRGITGMSKARVLEYIQNREKIKKLGCFIVDGTFTTKELKKLMQSIKVDGEIWMDVEGFGGRYLVSSFGRFASTYGGTKKILKPHHRANGVGDSSIKFTFEGKVHYLSVHRVVAEHFLPNIQNLECVWHKNGNKYDNHISNLEWISRVELGKRTGALANETIILKKCQDTGEILDEYSTRVEAANANFICASSVGLCLLGKTKSAGGYFWVEDRNYFSSETY